VVWSPHYTPSASHYLHYESVIGSTLNSPQRIVLFCTCQVEMMKVTLEGKNSFCIFDVIPFCAVQFSYH
jgi:hypothetical protein